METPKAIPIRLGQLIGLAAVLVVSCQSGPLATVSPTATPAPTTTTSEASTGSPDATALPTPVPTLTPSASPPPLTVLSDALRAMDGERIVFTRSDSEWPPRSFMIAPDGSGEIEIAERGSLPGVWSRDKDQLAYVAFAGDGIDPTGPGNDWNRPALIDAHGGDIRILDAWTGRHNLVPLAWTPDQSRLFIYDGFDAADPKDMGTFLVNSTDGGEVREVLAAPSDTLERPDFVLVSPDGTQLLVNRQLKGEGGNVFTVSARGGHLTQINPAGTISCEFPNWDFLERGQIEEAWSADGSAIAFCGFVLDDGFSSLYVAGPDGQDVRQIVGTDIGGVSAQWSPDGGWIAFTSKLVNQPQVWIVHPDGSGRTQLTDGHDGSTSVGPIWSPDGSRLVFQRKSGSSVSLWTMNADGSNQRKLTTEPIGTDYIGPYTWWPAPGSR